MIQRKTILSGIQPSGILTLGNYLGALKNWVNIQTDYNCMYFIANMHAITVEQEPDILLDNTKKVLMQYIACGLDPKQNTIFVQSQVHEHAELGWVLNCSTHMGELSRMTQYKDKSRKQTNVKVGLFDYPVLMAADILLYQADYVPVGEDQRQHLELTRDVAMRFNHTYGKEVFKIPEAYISKSGARIMSLKEPEKKMSKSDPNIMSCILLLDDKDTILKKFKRATTDSLGIVKYSTEQPGIYNLINIYSCVTGKSPKEIEQEFCGQGYGTFKSAVGEAAADALAPIQQVYYDLDSPDNLDYINSILKNGAEKAQEIASETLRIVCDTIGFYSC